MITAQGSVASVTSTKVASPTAQLSASSTTSPVKATSASYAQAASV